MQENAENQQEKTDRNSSYSYFLFFLFPISIVVLVERIIAGVFSEFDNWALVNKKTKFSSQ